MMWGEKMNVEESLSVIENAFCHLIYEKDIQMGSIKVLLHFPSIGISILERSDDHVHSGPIDNIFSIVSSVLMKEVETSPVYLDAHKQNFNVGYVINEILMLAEFEPRQD